MPQLRIGSGLGAYVRARERERVDNDVFAGREGGRGGASTATGAMRDQRTDTASREGATCQSRTVLGCLDAAMGESAVGRQRGDVPLVTLDSISRAQV